MVLAAFEAFFGDSWQNVELIKVKTGIIVMHLEGDRYLIEEKKPFSNLRVKSRDAALSDCTCFLRSSIDVCVAKVKNKNNSDEDEDEDECEDDEDRVST